jgi:hypothetical protein
MEKLAKELSRISETEEMLREAVSRPDEILYDLATGRYVALKIHTLYSSSLLFTLHHVLGR